MIPAHAPARRRAASVLLALAAMLAATVAQADGTGRRPRPLLPDTGGAQDGSDTQAQSRQAGAECPDPGSWGVVDAPPPPRGRPLTAEGWDPCADLPRTRPRSNIQIDVVVDPSRYGAGAGTDSGTGTGTGTGAGTGTAEPGQGWGSGAGPGSGGAGWPGRWPGSGRPPRPGGGTGVGAGGPGIGGSWTDPSTGTVRPWPPRTGGSHTPAPTPRQPWVPDGGWNGGSWR